MQRKGERLTVSMAARNVAIIREIIDSQNDADFDPARFSTSSLAGLPASASWTCNEGVPPVVSSSAGCTRLCSSYAIFCFFKL